MRIRDWSSDVCSSDLGADQGISSVPHRHSVTDKRQGVVRNRLRMSKLQAYELVDRFVVDHITHELRGVVSRLLLCRPANNMTASLGRASCRDRVCKYV